MTKSQDQLQNVNVVSSDLLATPEEVKRRMPLTDSAADIKHGGSELSLTDAGADMKGTMVKVNS